MFRSGITEIISTMKAAFLCYKAVNYEHSPHGLQLQSVYGRFAYVLYFNSWDFVHLE